MPTQQPDEYRTGHAKFYGQEFIVTPDVLIPRLETEEIVSFVYSTTLKSPKPLIADIGCGSGCLGLTLAKLFPQAKIYLSDISPKALEISQQNARKLFPKTNQLTFLLSNLLTNYPSNLLFDLIVANLPYIPSRRIKNLPSSVKDFEPHLALDGGKGGVESINRLIAQLPKHLKPEGVAILEIDDTHTLRKFKIPTSSVVAQGGQNLKFKTEIKKDQFGKNRFLIVRWISHNC